MVALGGRGQHADTARCRNGEGSGEGLLGGEAPRAGSGGLGYGDQLDYDPGFDGFGGRYGDLSDAGCAGVGERGADEHALGGERELAVAYDGATRAGRPPARVG